MRLLSLMTLAATFLLGAGFSFSSPVTIEDASFDVRSLSAGSWSNNLDPWQESGGTSNGNGFIERIDGFSSDGQNHLGMNLNHNVWQDLGVTYEANTRYTLTVAVGHRNATTQSGNQSQYLLAASDGTIYATGIFDAFTLPAQTFADAPALVFETADTPAAVGKTIRILLQARGSGRSHFDKIRLTAEPLTPPGTAGLSPMTVDAITATGAVVTGTVMDPGDDEDVEITFFHGPTNGELDPGAWESSVTLPGRHTGSYQTVLSGLPPGSTRHVISRATNSAGVSWSPVLSFETLPAAPTVALIPAEDITSQGAKVGAEITSTGGEAPEVFIHYGLSDGGVNPAAWASSASLGINQGAATTTLSGLPFGSTVYFRARAVNSGGESWSPASGSFVTLPIFLPAVENQSANSITGISANLRGQVVSTGNEAPAITLFYGTTDGGTTPGFWQHSVNLGPQSGAYQSFVTGLTPQTTYHFRSRATNVAGTVWAADSATFTTTAAQPSAVVINEFQFKPADESTAGEFIELHNPGDAPIDVSGWRLEDAITYTIPNGTSIAPGGYLVLAEDPPTMLSQYGVSAIGPWSGNLSSRGERIDLRNAGGTLIDRVPYGVGFPWPSAPDGGGPSVERIHPSLDGALAGSWRASGAVLDHDEVPGPFISAQENGWRYKKGTSEASDPVDAWRAPAFNDSDWLTGQAAIGYNDPGVNTTLSDMRYNYASVYLRKEFTVPPGQVPGRLRLRVCVDDGCVIWLNGHEIDRRHVGQGQLAHNYLAPANHEVVWEEIIIEDADDFIYGGTNVIAAHVFNTTLGSSDLSFDIELMPADVDTSGQPTPGRRNSVHAMPDQIPPHIEQVTHTPSAPTAGQAVTVSARIIDPQGVGAVSLSYQLVDPGSYIRLTDPAYETEWTTIPMAASPGDIWTATLPGTLQTHRRLVRYRIHFEDTDGNSQTVPYPDDESPNFAYFVSNGIPDWQGAFRPGTTPLVTYPAPMLESIPVYTLIASSPDVINSQYNSSFNKTRFTGTFVYEGRVYDHIEFRNRGEASTYVSGKNKWRFYFNRSHRMAARNADGEPYQETWKQFSGNACASPWAAVHRGAAGIDEALSFRAFQVAGMAAPHTHPYHFRVIRGAQEAPAPGSLISDPIGTADGQYAGDFWGLYLAVEPVRGNFLGERGLPDGNIYKIEGNAGDKKEQAVGQPVDSSDWNAFRDAHANGNPTESWWRANMDMDAYYTFHAINRLTGNVDLRAGNNHYFYHRSSDNRWVPVPWDLDMMFIPKRHWATPYGNDYPGVIHAHKSIMQNPALALEFRNRGREILDLLASDATPDGGQIGQLLTELTSRIHTPGQTVTWAHAEAAMWNLHPRTSGSDGNASGQTNHRGNFFRAPFNDSRMGGNWTRWLREPGFTGTAGPEDTFAYFLNYFTNTWPGGTWTPNNGDQRGYGYQYLLSEVADTAIPGKPTLTYTGDPSHPVNNLTFEASAFTDPQGAGTFAAREWRIAETGASGAFELEALWSTVTTSGTTDTLTFPSSVVTPGKQYRARVRQQDDTGRWSHWSEPVSFTAGEEQSLLVHYWNFNNTAQLLSPTTGNGTILTVDGPATVIESGTGQDFSAANARLNDPAGAHLRVNNPIGATVTFQIPTTFFEEILVRFETRRSRQGAGLQTWSYTTNGTTWQQIAQVLPPNGAPVVAELDFRNIPAASNNPQFAVRVQFSLGSGGLEGNNRFDNLTVTGMPIEGINLPPYQTEEAPARLDVIEGSSHPSIALDEWFADPDGDPMTFTVTSSLPGKASATINDGTLQLTGQQRGETLLTLSASDGENAPTELTVRVLVHPAPHQVASGNYNFTSWSPDAPERTYPAHMLFLQGNGNDSTLATLLDRAYFIPHDDYAAGDSGVIGFPYKATSRTRMNGLGTNGVSFINTGRGRDLGGALLALNTLGVTSAHVSFTAGTVTPNFRIYGLRLQYRLGTQGDFTDLTDGIGQPIEYTRNESAGHSQAFAPVELPAHLIGQPYVQLLWRYHLIEDASGARAEVRLDDILVSPQAGPPLNYQQWRTLHFTDPDDVANDTISGPGAAGPDGTRNLLRYALGLNPTEPVTGHLPRLADTNGNMIFRFPLDSSKSDIAWIVKTSPDLEDWSHVLFDSRTYVAPGTAEDGWTELPVPTGETQLFLRLEVLLK